MQLSLELQTQHLDIIMVSDIHLNTEMLERLSRKAKASGQHFDYCLVGGDIANCDHETASHNEQEMAHQTSNCLARLQDIFQCKVLWIPGNHDPLAALSGEQHANEGIINIHKRQFVLEVGLTIAGLGGSLPAYTDQERKAQEWNGFPYKSEAEFSRDVEEVFKEDEIRSSKIFLTHMGPSLSNTSVDRRKQSPIYAGSLSLDKLLERQDLLLLLHGHVHHGAKYDSFKGKPIVNPGPLLYGEYATLKLVRAQKVWNIAKISFEKIV